MSNRILFVDDDPNLLASCQRNFRRQFQIDTAEGAEAGLKILAERGPYAVVVADRQMPGMDGIQFLAKVRQRAPDTTRIMLTGNADLEGAIRVVNEGNIFRFLTKPCPPELLGRALEDGLAQYRLVTSEKELLSKTLSGSIKLLTDILSMVEPQAFGRAQALRDIVTRISERLHLNSSWELHLALMLAPIGSVTVPATTLVKARSGRELSEVETQMLARIPDTASRLLANIPRLEGVARIVRLQNKGYDGSGFPPDSSSGDAIPLGSRLLKILLDMTQLQAQGLTQLQALKEMQSRQGSYDPGLLASVRDCLVGAPGQPQPAASRVRLSIPLKDLTTGMVLCANLLTSDGVLLLSAGHEINDITLARIHNFADVSGIREPIMVETNPALAPSSLAA